MSIWHRICGGGHSFLESHLVKWAFVLSCSACSAGFGFSGVISLIGTLLAFVLAYHLTFRKQLLGKIFVEPKRCLVVIAAVFSLIAVGFQSAHFAAKVTTKFPVAIPRVLEQIGIPAEWHETVLHIGGYGLYLTTALAFFVFLYAFFDRFVPFIVDVFKESDHIERWYVAIVSMIALIAVAIIYNQTNVFYSPQWNDTSVPWDVVYTFDSPSYVSRYYYARGSLHRLLLFLFFLPFALAAFGGSKILFFVPNAYPIILNFVQVLMFLFSTLLLVRMLPFSGTTKICFLSLFFLCYSSMLNVLNMDGYVVAFFWMLIFIYLVLQNKKASVDYAFVAAAGSLITSAALLPLLLFRPRTNAILWSVLTQCFRIACIFLVFVFMLGQFVKIVSVNQYLYYKNFTGVTISFQEKIYQFFNFITSCFIKPQTIIDTPFLKGVGDWMNYQLAPVTSLNLLGVILLAVAVLGFVLNWKEPLARICGFWILFSFFVLCLVGWGTAENGLILYSLYFGWAYFCLVFWAIEKVLQKLPLVKYGVYTAAIITLAAINLPGIWDVIQFGIQYYPVR